MTSTGKIGPGPYIDRVATAQLSTGDQTFASITLCGILRDECATARVTPQLGPLYELLLLANG